MKAKNRTQNGLHIELYDLKPPAKQVAFLCAMPSTVADSTFVLLNKLEDMSIDKARRDVVLIVPWEYQNRA